MAPRKITKGRPVYIIDGSRTPQLKVQGKPGPFTALAQAVLCSYVNPLSLQILMK